MPATGPLNVLKASAVLKVMAMSLVLSMAAWPARAEVFQSILERYLEQEGLPGGVLLVSAPWQRLAVAAGIANRKTKEEVTPDTRFYIASVGKMAVAAAVLQQVEDGRLDLKAPVDTVLPGFPGINRLPNARKARLSQLLDHSSGIPDYLTDAFDEDSNANPKRRWTPAEALSYALDEDATHKPGKGYEYSNSNYVLLGAIIAAADGVPMEQALQRRIFDRAGMSRTTVGASASETGLAHGYADLEDSGRERDVSLTSWNCALGDGPLVSTAADLERFAFALFRDGRLMSPAMVKRMTRPSDQEEGYGLGVALGEDRGGAWVGHTGLYDGFEAELRYYPDHEAVIVFLTNGNSHSDDSVVDRAAAALFKKRKPSE